MRILLLNLGPESTQEVNQALSGQGYEITTDRRLTVDKILALSPEVLITEATPSDLSCCGLISQIKASPDPRTLKIVMIVHGGALERARGLDLGADDVISFPFEPLEFAARVRTQFREREPEDELRNKLKHAEQKEHLAEIAVDSLSGGTVNGRRFWLLPAVLVIAVLAVFAAILSSIDFRKDRTETRKLRAEVARLSTGVVQQGDVMRRAQQQRDALQAQAHPDTETRAALQAQSKALRDKMAVPGGADDSALRQQLADTQNRLNRL